MKLKKVTKIEDLRLRKRKLREEMILLDERIKLAGKDLQQQGFKAFMANGSTEVPTDQELEGLKKRLVFLKNMAKILDELLVKTVQHDRQLAIQKLEADIARSEKARAKRHSYYIKLKKQAQKVQEEDKSFEGERLELRSRQRTLREPTKTESLRLNKLEEFLKREFLLGDDLRERVLAARQLNRKVLEKGSPGIDDILYRNFSIKYSLETGQTLSLELTEQPAERVLRAENVTKESLLREVC